MARQPATPPASTHSGRRVAFGLNVTLALVAAVILLVFVNWISYRRFLRYDFTSTRQYSLSPQTREILKEIKEPYRVVTLLGAAGADSAEAREIRIYLSRARDLVDEYARYCRNLTVEHIDADLDAARVKAFYGSVLERFKDRLKPQTEALQVGRAALDAVLKDAKGLIQPLTSLSNDEMIKDERLKQEILVFAQYFARFDKQMEASTQQINAAVEAGLPDYSGALGLIRTELGEVSDKVFGVVVDRLVRAAEGEGAPDAVRAEFKRISGLMRETRKSIDATLTKLKDVTAVEDYDRFREQMATRNSVVILSPGRERVIHLDEMFRRPDPAQEKALKQSGEEPELAFQGEERLTGALMSLGMKNPPLVVFVYTGRQRAIGPNGAYDVVAQRLRRINFDVQEWCPVARPGPFGQVEPAAPLPTSKPGQKAVWIILPIEPPNPINPMASGGDQVATMLKERLAAGDSALVMVEISPVGYTGGIDPMASVFEGWSIKALNDRVLLREISMPNRQKRLASRMDVDEWPSDQPITRAIAGMPGTFLRASPLDLDVAGGAKNNVQVWPLVTIQKEDVWAEKNLQGLTDATRDAATAGKPYTIAAAAQNKTSRLVVVGDPVWASDQVTSVGMLGPGTAELVGALFPGNTELFVNSVFWLARMDQLIAASARSQDIRRIRSMTPQAVRTVQWVTLAGMPLATMLAGVVVWAIRRRA